jgi:hypothetical protein
MDFQILRIMLSDEVNFQQIPNCLECKNQIKLDDLVFLLPEYSDIIR